MGNAIEIENVSKRFRLHSERYQSLKEKIIQFGRSQHTDFWALRDIELEIPVGSTVGLLGHNGSGKSTLLKCVAGILQPTHGEIRSYGRMAALLELGAGFQPELTGRENIFLNGTILGMNKREIARQFDTIVEFSELQEFIDTQVRFYSSGMYVRLGFAVAVNVDPAILLVDEVLAVGDEAFQRKCLDRVKQFQREGRTIVVVTHAADLVRQVCTHAAVLDHGNLVFNGDPSDAVRTFREHLFQNAPANNPEAVPDDQAQEHIEITATTTPEEMYESSPIRIQRTEIVYPSGKEALLPGDPLEIRVHYNAKELIEDCQFVLNIYDVEGRVIFGSNTVLQGVEIQKLLGEGVVCFRFEHIPLTDGQFPISVGISSQDGARVYDWHEQRDQFSTMNPGRTLGSVDLPVSIQVLPAQAEQLQ